MSNRFSPSLAVGGRLARPAQRILRWIRIWRDRVLKDTNPHLTRVMLTQLQEDSIKEVGGENLLSLASLSCTLSQNSSRETHQLLDTNKWELVSQYSRSTLGEGLTCRQEVTLYKDSPSRVRIQFYFQRTAALETLQLVVADLAGRCCWQDTLSWKRKRKCQQRRVVRNRKSYQREREREGLSQWTDLLFITGRLCGIRGGEGMTICHIYIYI